MIAEETPASGSAASGAGAAAALFGEIAAGAEHDPREIAAVELGEQTAPRGVVAVVGVHVFRFGRELDVHLLIAHERDVLGADVGAGLEQHDRVLHHVLQLAHVAGPGVGAQRPDRGVAQRGERLVGAAVAVPVVLEEMRREHGHVVRPLAQGGDGNRHDAQTVVQVLAQHPRAQRVLGVAVRGRDEAHVHHRVGPLTAHAPHDAVLDHAQQLRLDRLRHLDQLIQEQRAAVGHFEQAGFVADRAGEGAFHVTEHFRFEQRLGKRGAVHRDERPAGAAAVLMDELGDHLLAAAALAGDEHRGVGSRDAPRQRDRVAEHGRVAEDAQPTGIHAGALLLRTRLARHLHRVRRTSDQHLELRPGERLGQIVPGPGAERFERGLDTRLPGDHDDDRLGVRGERGREQLHPRDVAHVEIDEHDVERVPLEGLERLVPATARLHAVAFDLERTGAALAQRALVVDHENADAGLRRRVDREQFRNVIHWGTRSGPAIRRRRTWRGGAGHHPLLKCS